MPTLRAADGRSALVLAHVGDDDRAATLIKRHAVDTSLLTVRAGGGAAVGGDIGRQVTGDLALAEAIAVPITLILLVLAFGSVVAALLPLVVGLLAVLATFAELAVLGRITDVSIFAINLTTALGLGLGIDYALLVVSRFREELAGGSPVAAAVVRTVETAGRTIAFSAATVMAALAALLVFPLFFLRSFAYAGIGVVAVAAVAGLVVLPAVLTVLGARVNALRLPWSHAVRGSEAPFWGRLAGAVMRRPLLAGGAVVALLLVLASPLAHVTFGTPDDRVLPATASSRVVGEAIRTSYTSKDSSAVSVVTDGRSGTGPLAGYAAVLSRIGHVQRVDSAAGVFVSGRLVLPPGPLVAPLGTAQGDELRVVLGVDAQSSTAERVVHAVRATPSPPGVRALVGGQSAELVDSKAAVGARLPWAGLLIAVTTFILLFLFTGSVLQPLRALVLNALTLSATLGAAVWVFQDGHLSSLLGFTPLPTDISMPVLLFCIAFGLSMDAMGFLDRMVEGMQELGFGVFSFDHEGGDGQFEFDFGYAPALQTADRITLFRLMAKQCGLIATFMRKPVTGGWGSGHLYNMSLEDLGTGQNLFRDEDDPSGKGWSKTAYSFTAGIMRHARSLAGLATPTVNSYKRLAPRLADGSISWAPQWAAYGHNNRSCMLRLPANRPAIENRGVDSAANTYLTSALMLAAGLEGIAQGLDPGEPARGATYDWQSGARDTTRLPRTLLEAVDAFEEDPLVAEVFAPQFVREYVDLRRGEWDDYHAQVTDWERRRYLMDL